MVLPNQLLGERPTRAEPSGDELELGPVVQEFPEFVRVGPGQGLPREKSVALLQRELRPFDVRRLVCLKDQNAAIHLADPVLGECGHLEESARPLDPREIGHDCLENREARLEAH